MDNYLVVLESVGDTFEGLEEEMAEDEAPLLAVHGPKRDLIGMRKSLWPFREVISSIDQEENPLIQESTRP